MQDIRVAEDESKALQDAVEEQEAEVAAASLLEELAK